MAIATDTTAECNRIENYIREHTAIDIAILGLGMNGHIGLNEPGTSPLLVFACFNYSSCNKKSWAEIFFETATLTQGITLGISYINESKTSYTACKRRKESCYFTTGT